MGHEVNLLNIDRGVVVAPAGCGKTHAIAEALGSHKFSNPILVLTHTNAGVAALRQRLTISGVPRSAYKLATIDGWAMRLVSMFPERSQYTDSPTPKSPNYLDIRKKAWQLLRSEHVTGIIRASYAMLIVDEYQDCSHNQHGIVFFAAKTLPTVVLGDPLQSIFGFGDDPLADWKEQVCKFFPLSGELKTPWRWKNAGNEELGRWLLDIRTTLQKGETIDLTTAPKSVRWVQLRGDEGDYQRLVKAARCAHRAQGENCLVIGDSRSAESRFRIAKNVPGIVTIEPVNLQAVTDFASRLDLGDGQEVSDTLAFAANIITNVDYELTLKRVKSLRSGSARKGADDLENAAIQLEAQPSLSGVAKLLSECTRRPGSRTYRPAILRACYRALNLSQADTSLSFEEAAIRVREENRAVGRQLPNSAIGSTLLLKGLEADHVVVLNAGDLDANNLYVAITRGAKSVTICSRSSTLSPN